MKDTTTSWGNVAEWYDELLEEGEGTYQKDVMLPNLIRLAEPKAGTVIVDAGCGQGFFSRHFAMAGATVTGTDISPELIELAKKRTDEAGEKAKKMSVAFTVAPAGDMPMIEAKSVDVVTIVLAIQNIEQVNDVFRECARILKPNGRLFVVLNHPSFRVPKESSWGWDERTHLQYRRVDRYLSEAKVRIEMHPGKKNNVVTTSFHRPLQYYFKSLAKAGFAVHRLEEWISNRQGPAGRKFEASEQARKEIPLFLCLEGRLL